MVCRFVSLAVLLVLAVSPEAVAQGTDEDAREVFEAGESAYGLGDFERALQYFQHAYSLSPRPELLYNIASAADRGRNDEVAVDYYERYLEALPDAENRPLVERRLALIQGRVEETTLVVETAEASSEDEPGGRPITWVSGITAAAFAIVGGVARVASNHAFEDLEALCQTPSGCTDEDVDGSSVRRLDRLTVASFVVAGAGVVAFVVALLLEGKAVHDEDSIAVDLGPAGVTLRGTF